MLFDRPSLVLLPEDAAVLRLGRRAAERQAVTDGWPGDLRRRLGELYDELDAAAERCGMASERSGMPRVTLSPDGLTLSTDEAAVLLGISPRAVRARLTRNSLAGVCTGGVWRVDAADVERLRGNHNGHQ